jgi:hypothetical protein
VGSVISAAILVTVLATVTMAEIITVMVTTASWIRAVLIILITGSPAACTQAIPIIIIIIIIITAFMAGFTRPTFTATFSRPQRPDGEPGPNRSTSVDQRAAAPPAY